MTTKPRAVLYVRLSRESAVSTSIEGQNADLYILAEREGWEIVRIFEDNGKSGGKVRENARAALDMLRENEADVLAVYAYDRWSRMGIADSAEVINTICARQKLAKKGDAPPPLFYAAREGIRSDQEGWEIRVAFAADLAQKERDRMADRRKASIARMRAQGRNPGNGPAPYGYRSAPFEDGRPGRRFVPDDEEAGLILEVAERLVRGESGMSVARDLTSRSVPRPRSPYRLALLKGEDPTGLDTGMWSSSIVAQLWVSEHLLGRVTVRTNRSKDGGTREGEVLIDPETGFPLQAHDAILDLDTMLALRARFATGVGKGRQLKRRAVRMLSGLAFCGFCGERMYVVTIRKYAHYRCAAPSKGIACPVVAKIRAETLEALVAEAYLAALGDRPAVEIVKDHGAPEVVEAIARVLEQIDAIGRAFADPAADVPALVAERAAHVARLEELRERARAPVTRRVDLGMTWGEAFVEAENDEVRRGYLLDAYRRIEVFRAKDAERIRLF